MDGNKSNIKTEPEDNTRSRSPRRVDRHRDRTKDRPKPYNGRNDRGGSSGPNKMPPFNRVFISNIPFEEKWQAIKDLFREKVGEVTYVELFTDQAGRSRGYGVVEFPTRQLAEECVEKMNKHEIQNRSLVVKADYYGDQVKRMLLRDGPPCNANSRYTNIGMNDRFGGMPMPMGMPPPMPGHFPGPMRPGPMNRMPADLGPDSINALGNTNQNLLQEIVGNGPIGNTVFVANLDYKVTYSKLKEVFKLAGNVTKVDLRLDNDNKSRGMATISFETNMEAVQAISMFNHQKLYDRVMTVRMDKENAKKIEDQLPSGLQSIGPALPLRNIQDSGIGGLSQNTGYGGSSSISGLGPIPGLQKNGGGASSELAALGLSALSQRSNRLESSLASSSLAGLSALNSLGGLGSTNDISRYGSSLTGRGDMSLDLDERARLLARVGLSEKERIDMDIARVDDRIRDINRSLAAAESRSTTSTRSNESNRSPPGSVVFVRNLPFTVTWQRLRQHFGKVGRVMFAQLKTDNGQSKGFGHVRYESPEQAQLAIQHFDGSDFDGRKIEVKLDERKFM